MNSEKHKQLIQKMKFHAFTNPLENTSKPYPIQPTIASGIAYPNDFVFVALTFEKLALYDYLHLSVSFHEAKKNKPSKIASFVPNCELFAWANLVYRDFGDDCLQLLYETESIIKNSNVRHLQLFFSKTTGEPVPNSQKEESSKYTMDF